MPCVLWMLYSLITFSSSCFICSPSKTCWWRCNKVWETDRTCSVKWKICNKYHENTPFWDKLEVKYISGWGYSRWRTHTQQINGTSKVSFFFLHHYEAVNLSARGICALWSSNWACNYYWGTLSPFTVGEGICGEKIEQIKPRQQVFYCNSWTHVNALLPVKPFQLILIKF